VSLRLALLISAALLAAGCVPASSIKPVTSLAEVGADQVIVVGRVELTPPLKPGEQKVGSTYAEYKDVAFMVTGDQPRAVPSMGYGDLKSRLEAPLGKEFFVTHPTEPFFILRGFIFMNLEIRATSGNEAPDAGQAPLNGLFRVDVKPGDRAVYIGTLRYTRDEFFDTEASVRDDFAKAKAEFEKRFGKSLTLRKALAKPFKG
jgi:hypothetical protein